MSLDVGVYNIGELYKARTQGAKDKAPRKRKGEGDLQSDNWHTRTRARFKTYSDESLRFVIKDATDAAESGEKMGNPKAGQYRDEAHYAAMELASRPFKKSRTQGAKDKQPRKHRPSYDFTTGAGQKRMMYENRPNQESGVGYNPVWAKPIDVNKPGDYGADPMGEGKFRMVPSGEVVDLEERNRRLKKSDTMFVILKSWFDEVSRKQSQEDMKTLAKLKRQQWPVRRKTGLVTAHRRKTLEEKRAERAQALELRTVRDASGRATGHWSAEHRFIPAPADISHPDGGNWTEGKIKKWAKDAASDMTGDYGAEQVEEAGVSMFFDLAEGVLTVETGLRNYLKHKAGINSSQGRAEYLADMINDAYENMKKSDDQDFEYVVLKSKLIHVPGSSKHKAYTREDPRTKHDPQAGAWREMQEAKAAGDEHAMERYNEKMKKLGGEAAPKGKSKGETVTYTVRLASGVYETDQGTLVNDYKPGDELPLVRTKQGAVLPAVDIRPSGPRVKLSHYKDIDAPEKKVTMTPEERKKLVEEGGTYVAGKISSPSGFGAEFQRKWTAIKTILRGQISRGEIPNRPQAIAEARKKLSKESVETLEGWVTTPPPPTKPKETKFDLGKMNALITQDAFLQKVANKGTKPEVIFNTYVLGDSVMERAYAKAKPKQVEAEPPKPASEDTDVVEKPTLKISAPSGFADSKRPYGNAYGLVKFKIPGLNGPRTVAGIVKKVLADGRLDIKTQQDGYFIISPNEILKKD